MERQIIGFIGLGQMGAPLARHLVTDGHDLRVYNRTREKAEAIDGARVCSDPREAARGVDILFSCLSNDRSAEEVFGSAEVFSAMGDGIHLHTTTVAPETSHRLAELAGGRHVTAALLGRPDLVAMRGHSFLCSGLADHIARVRPLLESLGSRVFEFGENPAAASLMKLSVNFLIASAIEAMGESLALVEKGGLEPEQAYRLWSETLFDCVIYRNYGRQLLEASHQSPLFRLELGLKDVGLVCQAAERRRQPMRLASLLKDRYLQAVATGLGDHDWTAIAECIRAEGGLSVPGRHEKSPLAVGGHPPEG